MTTITEALAELKTLKARIEKKRSGIGPYLVRPALMRDPMEKEGGTAKWIEAERQSIADMERRIVKIRTRIQESNLLFKVQIGEVTRSVQEWLAWRREVAPQYAQFLREVQATLAKVRQNPQYAGRNLKAEADATPQDIIVHVSEADLVREYDAYMQEIGELDGRLSLANATCQIDID